MIKAMHSNLKEVIITDKCLDLQRDNKDKLSMFVEHDGIIKQVSSHLVKIPVLYNGNSGYVIKIHDGDKKGMVDVKIKKEISTVKVIDISFNGE